MLGLHKFLDSMEDASIVSLVLHIFGIFMLLHIWQNFVCFGDFLPIRTLCDGYHKEFESHKRSILDISFKIVLPLKDQMSVSSRKNG